MLIIVAYVDGRPIPNSSSFLTKDASVNLGGGVVQCCSGKNLLIVILSPIFKGGNFTTSSSVSSSRVSL